MQSIQRLTLVAGFLLAGAVQAGDPFQTLYEAAQDARDKAAVNTPLHHPVNPGVVPSPVKSVIYGRRLPNGDYVTQCRIEHTHPGAYSPVDGPVRLPRERR